MNRLSLVTYAVILFLMSCNNLENEVVNNSNENSAINKYKIVSDEYIIWKARHMRDTVDAVSYTHLTLPTICSV